MRIRVILTGMPRMMSDILREIAGAADVAVVEEVPSPGDLLAAVDKADANFVIAGCRGGKLPAACKALLERLPRITVLTVSPEGRQGWLYRMPSGGRSVGDLSPVAVRNMITSSGSDRGRRYEF